MSKSRFIFLTGANKGIGLNLVQEILERLKPETLFATFRDANKSQELHELASKNSNLRLLQFDVTDFDNYENIVKTVKEETKDYGLNLLFNNAGITTKFTRLNLVKREQLMKNFEVNCVAPIMLSKAFLPLLDLAARVNDCPHGIKRAAIINMSTTLGSITENSTGGLYPYRCSKSALNAATKSMSVDLKNQNIISVCLHPGWVQTEMGGNKAPLTPKQSVSGIVSLLEKLEEKDNGKFFQWDGTTLPW